MHLPHPFRTLDPVARRGLRALATTLGVGYIIGWVMGYDTRKHERRGW